MVDPVSSSLHRYDPVSTFNPNLLPYFRMPDFPPLKTHDVHPHECHLTIERPILSSLNEGNP